jgi:hypothetical protein
MYLSIVYFCAILVMVALCANYFKAVHTIFLCNVFWLLLFLRTTTFWICFHLLLRIYIFFIV